MKFVIKFGRLHEIKDLYHLWDGLYMVAKGARIKEEEGTRVEEARLNKGI